MKKLNIKLLIILIIPLTSFAEVHLIKGNFYNPKCSKTEIKQYTSADNQFWKCINKNKSPTADTADNGKMDTPNAVKEYKYKNKNKNKLTSKSKIIKYSYDPNGIVNKIPLQVDNQQVKERLLRSKNQNIKCDKKTEKKVKVPFQFTKSSDDFYYKCSPKVTAKKILSKSMNILSNINYTCPVDEKRVRNTDPLIKDKWICIPISINKIIVNEIIKFNETNGKQLGPKSICDKDSKNPECFNTNEYSKDKPIIDIKIEDSPTEADHDTVNR